MTNEQIEKFLLKKKTADSLIRINFKDRQSLIGIFVKTTDFAELKSKNFWRIVTGMNIENYKKTNDTGLARIFSGIQITKLSVHLLNAV